jgi:hypothetical protein
MSATQTLHQVATLRKSEQPSAVSFAIKKDCSTGAKSVGQISNVFSKTKLFADLVLKISGIYTILIHQNFKCGQCWFSSSCLLPVTHIATSSVLNGKIVSKRSIHNLSIT